MSIDQFLLSADTTDLNYPEIRPTLDLNFARVKALDPRIDFTRASGGSYVGADGLIKYAGVNEARFDHDPETGESLGLLVEEARTNRFTRSEEFDLWGKSNVSTIENTAISPDGTKTADKAIENFTETSTIKFINRFVSISANTNYTFSVFLKAEELRYIRVTYGQSGSPFIRIGIRVDLLTGSFTNADVGTPTSTTIKKVDFFGNGWYRIQIGGIFDTTSTTGYMEIRFEDKTGSTTSYRGDGVSGFYLWGAQLEQGSFPTSYIPTQGSTRTRATESAAITGKNFSDFYNQSEGTIFSTTKSILTGTNGMIWIIDNASTNTIERTELFRVGTHYRARIKLPSNADIMFENVVFSDQDLNSFNNCIISYKRDDSTAFSNARTTFIVSRGEIPILNRLRFSSSGPQVKWISVFRYWPKRIPNIQIRLLTSK
jgi:hypothetical protein